MTVKWVAFGAAAYMAVAGAPLVAEAQSPDPYAEGQQQILQQNQDRDTADLLSDAIALGQAVHCRVMSTGLGELTLGTYWESASADFPAGLPPAPFAEAYLKATRDPIDCTFYSNNPQVVAAIRAAVRQAYALNGAGGAP